MALKEKIAESISAFVFEKKVTRSERAAITILVHPDEKIAYDILQARSGREFSKLIQSVVRETIREAEEMQQEAS
jgi:hypothetical protein